jgi:hypothetical protein
MTEEPEGPAPQGESGVESAELGEPERAGGEESAGERPDLDEREQRIRTERKPAGPPLEDGDEQESAAVDDDDPPEVDPPDE